MLPIAHLSVTQAKLRKPEQLPAMVEWVRTGGHWSLEVLKHWGALQGLDTEKHGHLIQISRFEDGALFIQDGHHRIVGVWLADRQYLLDDEYVINDWLYSDYLDINLEAGWFTPYDPAKETRVADWMPFKDKVRALWITFGEESAINFIKENKGLYAIPRPLRTVAELVETWQNEGEK